MDWVEITKGYDKDLPKSSGIVMAKRENGEELKVYFHSDQFLPLARYWKNHKLSHWQRKDNLEWLYDVTHWTGLPTPANEE